MENTRTQPEQKKKSPLMKIIGAGAVLLVIVYFLQMRSSNTTSPETETPSPTQAVVEEQPEGTPVAIEDLDQTNWKLVTMLQNGQGFPIPENVEVTLTISGNEFSGKAACNNYFGSFETIMTETGINQVTIGPIGSTMMACEQELMDFDTEYFAQLQSTGDFNTFEDTGLTLYSATQPNAALSYERVVE